nr:MAG TPA: hypothetical protein [Caudoviricetes sp.]
MGIIAYLKNLFRRLFKFGGEAMPSGLQVFDKTGVQVISLTDRLTKVSGVKRFDVIEPSGSASIELSKDQHIWYALNSYAGDDDGDFVSFSGTYDIVVKDGTISWVIKNPSVINKPCKVALIYGVM